LGHTTCKEILEMWVIEPLRRDIRDTLRVRVEKINVARAPGVVIKSIMFLSPYGFKSTKKKREAFISDHIHSG